jgi:beta-galactosidase/beta-glucuronidase
MTRWSKDVNPGLAPEYPRPMLVRPADSWAHLNGLWEIDISASSLDSPPFGATLPRQILVPYPVESPLSGIRQLPPNYTMWYRRMLPTQPIAACGENTTLLHFEAVDWNTSVWVNEVHVGTHVGGYDEFTFDITHALTAGGSGELIVGVVDPTTGVKGKQRRSAMTDPSGITYTSSSGIWGTVWLECVSAHGSIEEVVPITLADRSGFAIEVSVRAGSQSSSTLEVTLSSSAVAAGCADITREQTVAVTGGPTLIELQLAPPCRRLWSPRTPYLYNISVSLMGTSPRTRIDTIRSYAGLRTYTVADDGNGTVRPLLNGHFVYQMATLDQGFWPGEFAFCRRPFFHPSLPPKCISIGESQSVLIVINPIISPRTRIITILRNADGNYAAPTDAALRSDLEAHKLMGFNAVRKHQKVETRRWYHHADKLGLLVWQDIPCCADRSFPAQLANIVRKRRMYTSIVQYETFNEGGGMSTPEFVGQMVALVNSLDPTRPVDSASGGRDLCHNPPIKWQNCGRSACSSSACIAVPRLPGP